MATPHTTKLRALEEAAESGDCRALVDLGILYRDGLRDLTGRVVVRASMKKSIDFNRRAAELGDPSAMVALADGLLVQHPGRSHLAEAERWYRRGFRRGNTIGALNLAATYLNLGRHTAAVRWYRLALDAGDAGAHMPLAFAELLGMGTRRNVAAAMTRLRRVARGGVSFSQFEQEQAMLIIAEALREGWLVRRDYREGVSWLRRAARIGSASATGLLADLGESAPPALALRPRGTAR